LPTRHGPPSSGALAAPDCWTGSALRDDGTDLPYSLIGNLDGDDRRDQLLRSIDWFELDRQAGTGRRILIVTEHAGLGPANPATADLFSLQVIGSGGWDSVTAKHQLARLIAPALGGKPVPVEILHVGDFDKTGRDIYRVLSENVGAFVDAMGGLVSFTRLAVTPEQAASLPTGFDTDNVQVEAIPPDQLAQIIRDALEARIDPARFAEIEAEEEANKAQFRRRLDGEGQS